MYLVRSPADDYWYAIDAAADVVGGASAILQVGHLIFRATGNASLFNWEGPNPNFLKLAEGAMVPFAGPTERAIVLSGATPLGRRIRVGREEHRYIYTCVDDDGLP